MSIDSSVAYILGRPVADLVDPYKATDSVFGAARLDGQTIRSGDFKHCTFANVSFKEARIQSCIFLDCVFIGCYFRKAELNDSSFVGCRFIDCNFASIAVKSSGFRYSSFRECQIPYLEMCYGLPREPNLRESLARNLSLESSRLGLASEARLYRRAEIQAREEHLKSAVRGESAWYREHFDLLGRARAAVELSLSLMNRWLWGYGERARTLLQNLAILTFLVFPFLFYLTKSGLSKSSESEIGVWDTIYFSLENVVPSGFTSGISAVALASRLIAGLESLFGVVVIGLFAAYVFRWSLHR